MEHIWIWLSTDFWGSLFSEQPTQFCECKKDQASSKTKGDWALISPEMLSQRPLKWVQYANIFRKSVRKTSYVSWFFLLNRVICSCSFTLSPSNDRLNGCIIEMTWNPPQFHSFSCPWVISRAFYFTHSQWAMWNLILATRRKYVILWYLIWIYLCFNRISR
jgi:hypothetical protein